jgi:hypothetical protein
MRRRALAPVEAFHADALTAPIPDLHQFAAPVEHESLSLQWFAPLTLESPSMLYPSLPTEPAPPDPRDLEGPTGVWSKGWIDSVLAGAEAAR